MTKRQSQVFGTRVAELTDDGLQTRGGDAFRWKEVLGRPAILSAIYTNCPMEKMCPMVTSKIGDVQQRLFEKAGMGPKDFRVILFTFDPERDAPEDVAKYAEARGLSLENTVVVSGTSEAITRVMDALEVGAKQRPDGTFTHNLRTYVLDATGRVRFGFRKATWRPKDVAARLKSVAN